MSISGVSGNSLFSMADLGGVTGVDQTSATVSFSDFPLPPPRHHGGGGDFIGAVKQALASLEADTATSSTVTTSSSDNATSTQNVDAALNSFLQDLLTALHSESASSSTADSSTDNDSVTSASAVAAATAASAAAAANRPPLPPPGGGRLEEDLTKLVQSLSASESSTSSTDTASASDSSTSGSSSASSTNADLENSFANLLSALGDSGGTSLSSFLQSITTKLHATPASGNIINTSA